MVMACSRPRLAAHLHPYPHFSAYRYYSTMPSLAAVALTHAALTCQMEKKSWITTCSA